MTLELPDPRRFEHFEPSPLMRAAEDFAAGENTSRQLLLTGLACKISSMLQHGDESAVRDAMSHPSSSAAARALCQALDTALTPPSENRGVRLHLFAIPVLFVVGAQSAQRISGVLGDTDAIRSLFEKSGALGHCRNFGISNALTAMESVDAISWSTLYSMAQSHSWDASTGIDLAPADIDVSAERETVHLRFISGAALIPADAPAFVAAAGNVGHWGLQLTKELGRQLGTPDVSLLAIPRAPRSIVRATREGWYAARELGFQLFLSNALRQARMRVGEPDFTISSGSDQTIRIRLTSPFDDLFDQTYGWPLANTDDLNEIATSIMSLLEDARVERMQVVPTVEEVVDAKRAAH
ncbi:MAG: hypothetical protein JSU95_09540 [Betaproteobacteria bacterium]|nr:MAG: hypothetical protein JSU95_09540 [Betaproteobacteria bacterium]